MSSMTTRVQGIAMELNNLAGARMLELGGSNPEDARRAISGAA